MKQAQKIHWRLVAAVIAATVLAGCASQVKYEGPSSSNKVLNTKEVAKSRDDVWATLVPALGRQFFVINNLDKSSGLINVSYSGDPEKYVDCGTITLAVHNANGQQTYVFPGARANQYYQLYSPELILLNVQRRMELEGRINLILEAAGPQKTTATVNARYIVKRDMEARAPNGRGDRASDSVSFNGGSTGTFSGNAAQTTQCRSTGVLEHELLQLVN